MFLGMAGASIPSEIQGRSLVPLLKGSAPRNWRKSFYYKYYGETSGGSVGEGYYNHGVPPHDGVTDDKYKLIHYKHDDVDEWELFDLRKDPMEMKSEYENPEYTQVVARLKLELNRLKEYYKIESSEG